MAHDAPVKFLDMIGPEAQATFARLLYFAPQNAKAFDLMLPELARLMPTWPDNEKIARIVDYTSWADHTAAVTRRFEQWVQSWVDNESIRL